MLNGGFKMIQVFTQIGKWMDGILNWFFNLNGVLQLLFFLLVVLIGVFIYFRNRR
jgi:hypothetical protein